MKIHPLAKYVHIKLIPPKDSTKSGIVLPDSAQKGAGEERYKVLAIGGDVFEIEVGDTVIIQPFAGHFTERKGLERLIKSEEILALVELEESDA